MSNYRIIYDNPDDLDAPSAVVCPAPEFIELAMAGELPEIGVYWALQADEERAIAEGRHSTFKHDPEKLEAQFTAPRTGPLTEEEAMEYLVLKDVPRSVWGRSHNRPMFKIVKKEDVPSDRSFRNAWRLSA